MVEEEMSEQPQLLPMSIGERLRAAREARGMSVEQLSAESRITVRHLSQIEANEFDELPGRTYAVGFSRTYARLVGLNDDAIAREVRAELSAMAPRETRPHTFEPGDPARVPSRALAWISAIVAIAVFAGLIWFVWTGFVSPSGSLPWLTDQKLAVEAPVQAAAPPAAPATEGPVVFTALEEGVWVKFYDAQGGQLLQKEMATGETYVVPADAQGPLVWTARPDALAITVGGRPVPPLSDKQEIMKDVPVSAAALLARQAPGAVESTGAASATASPPISSPVPAASPTA
ncbi:helix-turn-helix domain-containing protein [Erythrobacter sp. SG61-1L]|uniref:helix-turn-helix domain-containing protein n=1 Tax=Erythrobacter sp. SG61-1L TaxID=1603897 RepID=UPI0006C90101|nr:helix-turn-helix domain-containing protein [Erythrobacter sp. SG61-1L]